MATKTSIRCDFYRVILDESQTGKGFRDLIAEIGGSPNNRKRLHSTKNDHPIKLDEVDKKGRLVFGDMIRIRMDKVPTKASLDGGKKKFDLARNEGVGEETAFLYDPKLNIMAVQVGREGVRAHAIQDYFQAKCSAPGLRLEPILTSEGYKRLLAMKRCSSIEVSVAAANNAALLESEDVAVTSINKLMSRFQGLKVHYVVSMNRKRGTLAEFHKAAMEILKLKDVSGIELSKVELTGKEDDEARSSTIDLLPYRMFERVEVPLEDGRTITFQARSWALTQAFNKRQNELSTIFL